MLPYVSFGDGAANEGNFHEGLNFASILDLPVLLYVKITNLLKELHMTTQVLLKQCAAAYNMPGVRVDGMDVVEVYKATQEAVERAKKVKDQR